MKKIFLLSFLLFFVGVIYGQIDPDAQPEITDPTGTDKLYSQSRGAVKAIRLDTMKYIYFGAFYESTPLAYVPTSNPELIPDSIRVSFVVGSDGETYYIDGLKNSFIMGSAGGGQTNTASNIGAGGVGVYDSKSGVDLRFRNINAGSSKISVTDDSGNDEIDIDVVESNLTLTESQISDLQTYLTAEVDGSITNEGDLTVGAGTASTSVISSNTSGSTDVTLTAGAGINISESGNIITLTASGSDTFSSIEVDGTPVSAAAPTLDFAGADFTLTESPTDDFDITFIKTGAWTGTFDGLEGTAYLARANHTGTQLASTISDFNHASDHERGGSDQVDGDHLDIDFTPTNYTPATTPAEAANVDDLTAHLYGIDQGIGKVLTAYKTADESINTDIIMSDDADLVIAVEANSHYTFRFVLLLNAHPTPDMDIKFEIPASAELFWKSSTASNAPDTEATTVNIKGTGSNNINQFGGIFFTAGTAGDLQLTWAQAISDANNITLMEGSFLELIKLD